MRATNLFREQQQRVVRLVTALQHDRLATRSLVARVIDDVLVHVTLEESISRSLARRAPSTAPGEDDAADGEIDAGDSHDPSDVHDALVHLAAAAVGSPEFAAAARELRRCFEERVAFETTDLLPRMEREYSEAELELIGRTIERCFDSRSRRGTGSALV